MTNPKSEKRVEEVLKMIKHLASGDFSQKLKISTNADTMDALASGLNMLSEELESNMVQKSLFISKNWKLEQALQKVSDYKTALDAAAIVVITDTKGDIEYVNDLFCQISGYSEKELIGQNQRIVNSGHNNKDFWKKNVGHHR